MNVSGSNFSFGQTPVREVTSDSEPAPRDESRRPAQGHMPVRTSLDAAMSRPRAILSATSLPAGAVSPRPRRQSLEDRVASEAGQALLSQAELPLAGYLLARASVGRRVDDLEVVLALRNGQKALAEGIDALHKGRGNVAADIVASRQESYVAIQVQRDAVEFLKRSATYQPRPTSARPTPLARNMTQLSACWPQNFVAELKLHFPDEHAADGAMDYITKIIAARFFAAGNCGEHARVVADARSRMADAPESIHVERAMGIDHAWTEARFSRNELRDEDIMMDAWMRTPAHLREDSHCGSAASETRVQLDDAAVRTWMSGVVAHLEARLQDGGILTALTTPAERLTRQNLRRSGVTNAEDSVPLNMRPDFLNHASARAADESTLSASIQAAGVARSLGLPVAVAVHQPVVTSILKAREHLLEQEPPTAPAWSTQSRSTDG